MATLLYKEEAYQVIGICMNIHKALGMGLKEINYKDAMEIDFKELGIHYEREKRFAVKYKGHVLKHPYYTDFVVHNSIVIEVKAATTLIAAHSAQALSYLAASGMRLALLVNFGEPSLTWKRVIL